MDAGIVATHAGAVGRWQSAIGRKPATKSLIHQADSLPLVGVDAGDRACGVPRSACGLSNKFAPFVRGATALSRAAARRSQCPSPGTGCTAAAGSDRDESSMAKDAPHRKRVKRYNIPGHVHFITFSTYRRLALLTNDPWRATLAKSVRAACDRFEFALWAYVFMPEHVHLLVRPRVREYSVSDFLREVKEPVSRDIFRILRENRSPLLERLRVQERPGKWCQRFWQEGGGYDRNVRTMEEAIEKARYCHRNPVTRGLVARPEQWNWSSYRWIELGDREDVPLECDEWDEGTMALAKSSRPK